MINQDYFQLMGLPERYQTDLDALERSFRSVQSSVHPDRFVRAMDADRRLAMQMSTQANEAFRVLVSPVERALYLCRRNGVPVDTDRGAGLNEAFLEDQMQWREQLDDARNDPVPPSVSGSTGSSN
jgi:molecular chaperone HscB